MLEVHDYALFGKQAACVLALAHLNFLFQMLLQQCLIASGFSMNMHS